MITPGDILDRMEQVIIGKRETMELVLAALLANGHVLIEDVPGVAKTLLARTLSRVLALDFSRVQMTPDLLPADLTGTGIWDAGQRAFVFQPGPIFCQILLADELNRATPRTQAGLLEAMEEHAVTADGRRHALPEPFFVIATQNPLEQQGVFPLPEAQVDRFLVQLAMGYPDQGQEVAMVEAQARRPPLKGIEPLATEQDVLRMRGEVEQIHTSVPVMEYLVRLARASRAHEELTLGASPRASLGLHHMARAVAYIEGAAFVTPDHVQRVAAPVLRHRLILTPQARLGGLSPDDLVERLLDSVEVPVYVES